MPNNSYSSSNKVSKIKTERKEDSMLSIQNIKKKNKDRKHLWNEIFSFHLENLCKRKTKDLESDLSQIQLDVNRSFLYTSRPIFDDQFEQKAAKSKLLRVLVKLIKTIPSINYTQGLHEFVTPLILVCGERNAFEIAKFVVNDFYRDFLKESMNEVIKILDFAITIIKLADNQIYTKFKKLNINGHFMLPWLLTWFSLEKTCLEDILCIYDFIFSTNFLMPYYLCATKVLMNKKNILKIKDEESDMLYFLYKLPSQLETEEHFLFCKKLFNEIKPKAVFDLLSAKPSFGMPLDSALMINILKEDIKDKQRLKLTRKQKSWRDETLHNEKFSNLFQDQNFFSLLKIFESHFRFLFIPVLQ